MLLVFVHFHIVFNLVIVVFTLVSQHQVIRHWADIQTVKSIGPCHGLRNHWQWKEETLLHKSIRYLPLIIYQLFIRAHLYLALLLSKVHPCVMILLKSFEEVVSTNYNLLPQE